MAKLHNYYVLCPLIDQKSFLGVSQAKNKNCVVVSLGRNVVNVYRLNDQKQTGGWTSKDHITSVVIYDTQQNSYVGIFNNNIIKLWTADSQNLDKLKKYKFPLNIMQVFPRKTQPALIIFSNGNCASLPYAIDNRKTYQVKPIIKDMETILHTATYTIDKTDYICHIVMNNKENIQMLNCPLMDDLGDLDVTKLIRINVGRDEDVHLVGQHFVKEENIVYFLWSDAKMTAYDIVTKSWRTIGTVPWISTLNKVSITWMGKNHLIMFGCNVEQDGAIIVAYNIVLGVGSCKYPMKMYTENANLYCIDNHIILEASNHIGILTYVLEPQRNISNLLGTHEIIEDEHIEIANWDMPSTPLYDVSNEIEEIIQHGLTERNICSQVIPPLLEKRDYKKLLHVLKDFKDVPESVLVALLNYAIKLVKPENIDLCNIKKISEAISNASNPTNEDKFALLDYIFEISFSDALLIPYLRNGLVLDDALFLMTYISHMLVYSDTIVNSDYETKLLDWCTLLMDAFYQQYVLTKDEVVTCVLTTTKSVVSNLIKYLDSIDKILPLLNKVLYGKLEDENDETSYSIELIQL